MPGDEDELADALAGLAERLLVIRPFIPDKKNALPAAWRAFLKQWVSGVDVNVLGADNMRIVEDAFMYRLVWALEAIRTRRVSLGWSPEIIPGGGAATLETGVPQFHDGDADPSRLAVAARCDDRRARGIGILRHSGGDARLAERQRDHSLNGSGRMADGRHSRLVATLSRGSPERRIQAWTMTSWKRLLDLPDWRPPPSGLYRSKRRRTGRDLALNAGLSAYREIQKIPPRRQTEHFRRTHGRRHRSGRDQPDRTRQGQLASSDLALERVRTQVSVIRVDPI